MVEDENIKQMLYSMTDLIVEWLSDDDDIEMQTNATWIFGSTLSFYLFNY